MAVVSGAAGLIGGAITGELLAQGAYVIALDCDEGGLANLARRVDSDRLTTRICDLTDADGIAALDIAQCDVLIHAAGIQFETSSLHDTDEQWGQSLDTNVAGPARLTRKLLPKLIERKGNIIMVGSIHAELPSRWASYSAAKAAQAAMIRE